MWTTRNSPCSQQTRAHSKALISSVLISAALLPNSTRVWWPRCSRTPLTSKTIASETVLEPTYLFLICLTSKPTILQSLRSANLRPSCRSWTSRRWSSSINAATTNSWSLSIKWQTTCPCSSPREPTSSLRSVQALQTRTPPSTSRSTNSARAGMRISTGRSAVAASSSACPSSSRSRLRLQPLMSCRRALREKQHWSRDTSVSIMKISHLSQTTDALIALSISLITAYSWKTTCYYDLY